MGDGWGLYPTPTKPNCTRPMSIRDASKSSGHGTRWISIYTRRLADFLSRNCKPCMTGASIMLLGMQFGCRPGKVYSGHADPRVWLARTRVSPGQVVMLEFGRHRHSLSPPFEAQIFQLSLPVVPRH